MRLILILLAFVPSINFFAQPFNVAKTMIADEMDSVRNGSHKTNDYRFEPATEMQVLRFLRTYDNDSSVDIRLRIQILKVGLGHRSKNIQIRQEVVQDLLLANASGVSELEQYANNRLLDLFKETDYSDKANHIIKDVFDKTHDLHHLMLVCGLASAKEMIPRIKKYSAAIDPSDANWYSGSAWYADLALARMNAIADETVRTMVAAVESETQINYRVIRLEQLAYTRHPVVLKLLLQYLEGTDRLPPLHSQSEGIEVKYYIIWYLAKYMDAFPVKDAELSNYTPDEFEKARAYLKSKLI